jgi:hypothetical protein
MFRISISMANLLEPVHVGGVVSQDQPMKKGHTRIAAPQWPNLAGGDQPPIYCDCNPASAAQEGGVVNFPC